MVNGRVVKMPEFINARELEDSINLVARGLWNLGTASNAHFFRHFKVTS